MARPGLIRETKGGGGRAKRLGVSTQCVEIGRPELVGGKASKAGAQPPHSPQLRGLWRQWTTASPSLVCSLSLSLVLFLTSGHAEPGSFASRLPSRPHHTQISRVHGTTPPPHFLSVQLALHANTFIWMLKTSEKSRLTQTLLAHPWQPLGSVSFWLRTTTWHI